VPDRTEDWARRPPMRIAIVAPPWYPIPPTGYGGIERICYELVEGLIGRGHDITLIANGTNETRAKFVAALPEPPVGLGGIEHPVQEVRYAAAVAQVLKELPVDLVHDHSLATPLAALSTRMPTLLTAHGPTHSWLGDYYRKLGLPIVAISEAQRAAAPDLPWLATIANAISVDDYPFQQEKGDYVLSIGRLSPEKGVHLAVTAAQAAGVRIVVAGKCAEAHERKYRDEQVFPLIGEGDEIVGEVSGQRKYELIGRARGVLATVTWEEPFGLAYIEALACGTPVVGLARGSIPEIISNGRSGWVCADPQQLPEAISRLGEIDPHECRREAKERFDTSVMVHHYERAYRQLIQRSKLSHRRR
jgi:glycosyltransferase involved in cell wall biosynthesis